MIVSIAIPYSTCSDGQSLGTCENNINRLCCWIGPLQDATVIQLDTVRQNLDVYAALIVHFVVNPYVGSEMAGQPSSVTGGIDEFGVGVHTQTIGVSLTTYAKGKTVSNTSLSIAHVDLQRPETAVGTNYRTKAAGIGVLIQRMNSTSRCTIEPVSSIWS